MIDWILSVALEAQAVQASRSTASTWQVVQAERQAAAAQDQDDAESSSPRRSSVQSELGHDTTLALRSMPIRVGQRFVEVDIAPRVTLPSSWDHGGARDSQRRAARSMVDVAAPSDDGEIGIASGYAAQSKTYKPGRTGALVTPYTMLWNGQDLKFFELTLNSGPTTFTEKFLLYIPPLAGGGQKPLVNFFHKFGSTHWDVWNNTTFIQECHAREWFLVSSLGATNKSMSSIESQLNREAVLDWLTAIFPMIDRERLYGVGFSMGGGSVLNFAARHLDPARHMLAAVVNHSGGVDLNHTYFADPPARFIMDFWYGDGSVGSADPWRMARSSVLTADPITGVAQDDWSLARHLVNLPMRTIRASDDPIAYLSDQNDNLHALMGQLGAVPQVLYGYYVLPYTGHSWDLLNASATLDFLGSHTLTIPTSGQLLADHDGAYYHFTIEQDQAGAFTPLDWSIDEVQNKLVVTETANLRRLIVDTPAAGLDPTQPLQIELDTADGHPDEIVFRFWPQAPVAVQRDGQDEPGWSYDPTTDELVVTEVDPGLHVWNIVP